MEHIDFKKIFDSYSKAHPKIFAHDRSQSVGASEAFDCIRKTFFKKTGAAKDPDYEDSWGATSRGDLIENYHVVPALDEFLPEGAFYVGAGEDQKTFIDKDHPLSATPDGLVSGVPKNALKKYGIADLESDCFVLEIKSIDPRVNLLEEKAIHKGQAIVQLGLIREQTEYKPMYAVILYFNASFLDDISVFVVKFDEVIFNNARARSKQVFGAKEARELTAEGKITHSCDICPYTSACASATEKDMPPEESNSTISQEDVDTMESLAVEAKAAAKVMKDAEVKKKILDNSIKDLLKKIGRRRLAGPNAKVSYTFVQGRSKFDHEAMKEDGIDLDSYKTIGDGHERITVTLVGKNKDKEEE